MKFTSAVIASALLLAVPGFAPSAQAAPTNDEALSQIDAAINTHYASAALDKAEQALMGIIESCGQICAVTVTSRAWMYIGIVRGSGRDDLSGAASAFGKAKSLDPSIALDELFATDLVKGVFEQTRAEEQLPLMNDMRNRAEQSEAVSEILCSLTVSEVETERPIPISCQAPPSSKVVLSYKHESSNRWIDVQLSKRRGAWVGGIPCDKTRDLGVLAYRIHSLDSSGETLNELGSLEDPLEVNLVDRTDVEPPSLPGQPAPESCRPKEEVPTTAGPALGSYGDSCKTGAECQGGLACSDGQCVADMSCSSDAECPSGSCESGMCVISESDCEGTDCSSDRSSKNWIGIQAGIDFSMVSGTGVCGREADTTFSCYEEGEFYQGVPNNNFAGDISSGFRTATSRVMLSYERGLGDYVSLEARAGFAFNGGPTAPDQPEGDGSTFLPYHAEGRLKVYITPVFSDNGRGLLGATAFFTAGGGLAQVDPQVTVPVAECAPADRPEFPGISEEQNNCRNSQNRGTAIKELNAVQRQGQGFITAGLGFRYGFTRNVAALVNVNSMILVPSSGVTISPSIGILAGF